MTHTGKSQHLRSCGSRIARGFRPDWSAQQLPLAPACQELVSAEQCSLHCTFTDVVSGQLAACDRSVSDVEIWTWKEKRERRKFDLKDPLWFMLLPNVENTYCQAAGAGCWYLTLKWWWPLWWLLQRKISILPANREPHWRMPLLTSFLFCWKRPWS